MPASSARPSCPACGIAVTPGYQRCPKCHRPLPSSVRFSRINADGGGGTSVEPPDEPVARWPWYVAGAAILAGAVAVVVIGSSGGKPPPQLPDDPVTSDEDAVDVQPGSAGDDEPTPVLAPRTPDPGPAADLLAKRLANVRLYATVEAFGDTVEIRSSFCDDPGMPGVIAQVAPELREAALVTVRCRALHGAEAWTRPLP